MLDVDGPPLRRCWDSRAFLSAMFRSSFNFFFSLFLFLSPFFLATIVPCMYNWKIFIGISFRL